MEGLPVSLSWVFITKLGYFHMCILYMQGAGDSHSTNVRRNILRRPQRRAGGETGKVLSSANSHGFRTLAAFTHLSDQNYLKARHD